ncbi:MAG: hypothetical protein AB1758_22005 [Candidatus Eremiobacterota bacterium]
MESPVRREPMGAVLERLGPLVSLSVVGTGKNVGKTTLLNRLVAEAAEQGRCLGLTSIGRDGEAYDAISAHPKPPILVPRGTLVATAEGLLPPEDELERLATTGFRTPLGPIVLARARSTRPWEVAGPIAMSELGEAVERFFQFGAALVLVDGAFGRRSLAAPTLTQATVVVTGAALDPSMDNVVRETEHLLDLFGLPASRLPPALQQAARERHVAILQGDEVQVLPLSTALGAEDRLSRAIRAGARAFALGTALTPRLMQALTPRDGPPVEVVLRDATCALVGPEDLHRFRARGGHLSVVTPIRLPMLAANPYSPYGWSFPQREFQELLARRLAPLPVVDVVAGVVVQC